MKNFLRLFRRMALCAAVACPLAVSCDMYDDTEIRDQLDMIINKFYELEQKMNAEINALKDMLEGKLLISGVQTNTATGVTTVTLSNKKELNLLPKTDLSSTVTYITSGGVDYWAYIDGDGKKQYFLNDKEEAIPVVSEMPEVITRDDDTYLVIGGREYPLSGNSVFSDYELITNELTGEVYAVTFTFGENMSFTVTVDGAAGFMFIKNEGWTQEPVSEQYVPSGMSAKVQYQAYGVVDYLLQVPDGWRVKAYEDQFLGNGFDITAPSAEHVASGIAADEGELKVVAVLEGGKAMIAKLDLTTKPFKEFSVSFGKANVKMNNGLYKYVYGVCEASVYDEDTIFAKAVECMDLYDYPAGYGVTFYDLEDEPLSNIAQADLSSGGEFVFWAIPAIYDEQTSEYSLMKGTILTETVKYVTAKMEVTGQSARDADVDIEVKGAESYYFGLTPKVDFFVEDVVYRLNMADYYTPKTELAYSGSVFSFAGITSAPSTEYVAWLAVAEAGKTYAAEDVLLYEFATVNYQPGSAVKVSAEVAETSFDVTASLSAPQADMVYYAFMTASEAKKYVDDAARAAYLFQSGTYAAAAEVADIKASDYVAKMSPEMSLVLIALATDTAGKYSKVLVRECATAPLQYNDLKVGVEMGLNTPEEVKLNVSVTGGKAVGYLYWIGKTTENTWYSLNYLGGKAETAQQYMYLNPTASRLTSVMTKYPVTDGVISIKDHTPGLQYVIVIMAKDESGLYSKAAELKFKPNSRNIGTVVLDSDPKWAAAKPSIEWVEERFTPQVGMMPGSYAFKITLPVNYTAYVLTATDEYFTMGNEEAEPISVEEKILTVIDWTDKSRDSDRVTDLALYEEKGYPYGHEFYHFHHVDPNFGSAVVWASKEVHDSNCQCVEKEVEQTTWDGKTFIRKHVLTFNDGKPMEFAQYQAIADKNKVVDRVFVVLQDLDGNCYQTYEWDVPFELFANAK